MSMYVTKRTEIIDGEKHYSLVPVFAEDMQKIKRLGNNTIIQITAKQKRDRAKNGHMWKVITFCFENRHEKYNDAFRSPDELYNFMKMEIGFTVVIGTGDNAYKFPRHTNFKDCPDEQVYLEKFYEPGIQWLTRFMEYSDPFELQDAAMFWFKNK